MIKKILLATTIATFASTAAMAGGDAPAPRMTAKQIETYSTQSAELDGSSAGIVLPIVLTILMICAVACGGGSSSSFVSSSYAD